MGSGASSRQAGAEATLADVSIFLQQLSEADQKILLATPEDVVIEGYQAWANAKSSPKKVNQSPEGHSNHVENKEDAPLRAQVELVAELVAKFNELEQLVVEPPYDYDSDMTRVVTGQDFDKSRAYMQSQVASLKGQMQDAKESAQKLRQHIAELEMARQKVMEGKKKGELGIVQRCIAFSDKLMGDSARVSMACTQFRNSDYFEHKTHRDCEALCDTAMWTGRHIVEFRLLPSGKPSDYDSFGMSAPDEPHDEYPGKYPKSCGLSLDGFWMKGEKGIGDGKQVAEKQWCKKNDIVQLDFDASTHTLEIYCNGTLVSSTDQVEVGWHFSVGRGYGEVHVEIVQPVRLVTCEFTLPEESSEPAFVKCLGMDGGTLACIPCKDTAKDVAWLRAVVEKQLGNTVRLVCGSTSDARELEDGELLTALFPAGVLDKLVEPEDQLAE